MPQSPPSSLAVDYGTTLFAIVQELTYKPGWYFRLHVHDAALLSLVITATVPDSDESEEDVVVTHSSLVPRASHDRGYWQRWVFQQILMAERHETEEFFRVAGEQVFRPHRDEQP